MRIPYSNVDAEYSFANFSNVTQTKEFKELLKKGIITKTATVLVDSSSYISSSNGIVLKGSKRNGFISIPKGAGKIRISGRVRPSISIKQTRQIEVFVLDIDKIFSNYKLDAIEIAGIVYTCLSGDAIGMLFTLYGVLKNVIKAGSSYISEDVAYMHTYFRLKLKNNNLVSEKVLRDTYKTFFDEVRPDEDSSIGSFDDIFDKMILTGLIKRYKNGQYYISRTIGLGQEKRRIRGYVINKDPLDKRR